MRKSKIVHVRKRESIPEENESEVIYICEEDLILTNGDTGVKSINTTLLNAVLKSIEEDAYKINRKNYLASRRFRVNTVSLEKAFKLMRELSPVKKKKKKKKKLL